MRPAIILSVLFTVVIGAIVGTYSLVSVTHPDGVTCAQSRLASFGFTHKQLALAELAAIATWQREAEEKRPGYSDWHQAFRRSMKCNKFKNSDHFQCIVSALPCKYEDS